MTEGSLPLALEASGVSKSFNGSPALKAAHLAVTPGSIHALLGENGAGKSTLIKTITGVHQPDSGRVLVFGDEVDFQRPHDAIAAGISAVYQERNLVPDFSVAENLFLGSVRTRGGVIDYQRMHADAAPWLERVGLRVDGRARAGDLSVAQGQLLEIARALALEAKVLLLDEPTASITDREAALLFDMLRELRDRGSAILFVSHKLEEVFALCDTVTVLRDGETVVDGASAASLDHAEVITAMVGRSVTLTGRRTNTSGRHPDSAAPTLELRNLSTSFGHANINLALAPGRIVGLYGLVGAGRTELAKTVMGLGSVTSGQILRSGSPVSIRNPDEAIHRFRIGYVSEDRKGEGLILTHSVGRNLGITVWDRIKRRLGYITDKRQLSEVKPALDRMDVKHSSPFQPVGQLSGGNQQKVSVGKWLAGDIDVLIVDEPTIGVDVRTKEDMYLLMEDLAAEGRAILLISSDLAEIVRMSDEIVVMAGMQIVDELENDGDYSSLSERIMTSIMRPFPRT